MRFTVRRSDVHDDYAPVVFEIGLKMALRIGDFAIAARLVDLDLAGDMLTFEIPDSELIPFTGTPINLAADIPATDSNRAATTRTYHSQLPYIPGVAEL